MYSHSRHGFALAYSLIIGLLCVMICFSLFSLELLRAKNIDNYSEYVLKTEASKKYNQKLLKMLSEYIYSNINNIGEVNIKKYFVSKPDFIIKYERYYIKYNNVNNYFNITENNGSSKIISTYKYFVESSKIIYQKVQPAQ